MLCAAGMDEADMRRWHAEFERRAPKAHHQFLLGLGITDEEVRHTREHLRQKSYENLERRHS